MFSGHVCCCAAVIARVTVISSASTTDGHAALPSAAVTASVVGCVICRPCGSSLVSCTVHCKDRGSCEYFPKSKFWRERWQVNSASRWTNEPSLRCVPPAYSCVTSSTAFSRSGSHAARTALRNSRIRCRWCSRSAWSTTRLRGPCWPRSRKTRSTPPGRCTMRSAPLPTCWL